MALNKPYCKSNPRYCFDKSNPRKGFNPLINPSWHLLQGHQLCALRTNCSQHRFTLSRAGVICKTMRERTVSLPDFGTINRITTWGHSTNPRGNGFLLPTTYPSTSAHLCVPLMKLPFLYWKQGKKGKSLTSKTYGKYRVFVRQLDGCFQE